LKNSILKYIVPALAVLFTGLILYWLMHNPSDDIKPAVPGMDNRGKGVQAVAENINIGEHFKVFDRKDDTLSENWPRFRGSDFDNISKSSIALKSQFSENGPPVLWKQELGEGHGGAAIYKGKVYILDYDEDKRADMLRCFALITGEELWRRWYKVRIKRNHGISRTVPAVTEKYILSIGPRCHVMCLERETGDFLWGIDIEKEYESEVPLWYTGQCPLIDKDEAIIATGGKELLIAVDCKTGKVNWKVPNPNNWKMSHSSIMPYNYAGKKMYVYAAIGGLIAVSAEEEDKGKVLWTTTEFDHKVIAPSPVCMPDGKIFLTAGYGAGAIMLQLKHSGGEYSVEVLDEYKPAKGLACEQQSPIYYKEHLFGIMPKDGGALRNQLICVKPSDTKEVVWKSGKTNRFGLGPYIIANEKMFLWNDNATLYILDVSTKAYKELASYKLLDGHDAWAPPALANGYMVLRDSKTMICIDLNKKK